MLIYEMLSMQHGHKTEWNIRTTVFTWLVVGWETLSIERLEANVCFFISASRNGDST